MRFGRIVFSRLEYVWLAPHPPLGVLQRGVLWIPEDGATSKYTRSKLHGVLWIPEDGAEACNLLPEPATCYIP